MAFLPPSSVGFCCTIIVSSVVYDRPSQLRDKMLQAANTSELFPFIYSCCSTSSSLYFHDTIISSAEGGQQGDPLGPLLFCLVIFTLTQMLCYESRKREKYILLSRSHHFVPIANETSGALGPNALSLFRDIGRLQQAITHDHQSLSFLLSRECSLHSSRAMLPLYWAPQASCNLYSVSLYIPV